MLKSKPVLDPAGILYFKDSSVTLSLTQCEMLAPLVARYGQIIYRTELREILEHSGSSSSSNALDLHVMRLRRRLQVVGLAVRNVWGRGFVLGNPSGLSADSRPPRGAWHARSPRSARTGRHGARPPGGRRELSDSRGTASAHRLRAAATRSSGRGRRPCSPSPDPAAVRVTTSRR
ncbi:hypothetical protein SGLAM104S_04228 [Streptomyces glaucescens]